MSTGEFTPTVVSFGEDVLERMVRAALAVQERLNRSTSSLEISKIPFAVSGSNATAIWISSVDESAVRQARNVELVLRRSDLQRATSAFQTVGFVTSTHDSEVRFLDGPTGKWRDAVEITFANEPVVNEAASFETPGPEDSEIVRGVRVLRLAPLVELQLRRYRLDDKVDLHDLIDVGMIDRCWLDKLPRELEPRLQELLDNPEG